MMLSAFILGVLFILKCAPDTSMGRWLAHWFVAKPASLLTVITRFQMTAAAGFAILAGMLIYLEAGEAMHLLGMAAPEITTLLLTFEITTYADMVAMGFVAWSSRAHMSIRSLIRQPFRRNSAPKHRRAHRVQSAAKRGSAANDDDPGQLFDAA